MAIAIGYLRRPDDLWFEKLKECLDRIDNQLRSDRNRIVHDVWMVSQSVPDGEQAIIRKRFQAKLKKPQAFQNTLEITEINAVTADEIWKLRDDIRDANTMLSVIWGNFLHPEFLPWP